MYSKYCAIKCSSLVIILFLAEFSILIRELQAATDVGNGTVNVVLVPEPSVESSKVDTTPNVIREATSLMVSTSPNTQGRFLLWDKRNMQTSEFQITNCARLCLGNTLLYLDQCQLVECFRCDCNKPLCELYGTCCPDYDISMPVNISSYTNSQRHIDEFNLTCEVDIKPTPIFVHNASNSFEVKFICELVDMTSYLFIRSCPTNYPIDSRERTRCEEDIPATDQDFETFLPVTDMTTGHTYYNRYCAICNDITIFTSWNTTYFCGSYMNVYQAVSPEEFLKLSLRRGSGCETLKVPPSNISPQTCLRSWFGSVISSCNVTGLWDVYDEDVLRACEDISGIANRTRLDFLVYKNIFCVLCNINAYSKTFKLCATCRLSRSNDEVPTLPFSFLLSLKSHSNLDTEKCPENTVWAGPDKTCLPLQCSPGKTLNNGTCSTVNQDVSALLYLLHVLYIPHSAVVSHHTNNKENMSSEILHQFVEIIRNFIFYSTRNFNIQLSILENYEVSSCSLAASSSPCEFQLPWVLLKAELEAPFELRRDDFEMLFVSDLVIKQTSLITDNNYSLTLKPILNPKRLNQFYFDCPTNSDDADSCFFRSLDETRNTYLGYNRNEFLVVEPQLNCPFISLNSSDYSYKNDNLYNSSITLYLSNEPITIYELDDLNLMSIAGDGTLKICQELWEHQIKSYLSRSDIKSILLVMFEYILTWVCLLSSIICLVLTVITYFLFPVLLSFAGKNNVFLSLSLLMAQSFLLAASHVKQTGYLCTFLAISTHSLWLSMFCWCFTTCFHMFRIFTAQTRTTHATVTSERLNLVKNVVGCSLIPALIIIGVIVTNYFTTEGRLIGYGRDKCFLDSTPLVAITLITPLSFILLCNIFFFSVTVIKIHNVRKLQTQDFKQDDRANLYIYIKLSSMTGMFWILNIIAEATDNDPLRFIAIFLNGLQGVFIFLSYICNRRVFKLYARSLGFERLVPTTSTSGRSTMAKVLSVVVE